MAKRTGDTRIVGRAQGARPDAVPEAHKHVEAERSLVGALAVPIEQIIPDPAQPRQSRDQARLDELAASIKEYGVLQPLLVREHGLLDDGRTQYMIVAGGRRYAAAQQAGVARLPVVVRDTEGAALRLMQLIENVQRQDLAPLEEARAFKELMDAEGLDAVALGKRLHITGQHVRDRLLLLTDEVVASAVQRRQIAPTTARDLLRLPDESRVQLRARVDAGENLAEADIREARARNAAEGVVNPRATGGGRAARKASRPLHSTIAQEGTSQQTPFAPDPVQGLYEAFKGWESQVSQLAPHDLQRLVGLIRGDMQSFIASVTEMTSNERDGAIEAVRTGDTL